MRWRVLAIIFFLAVSATGAVGTCRAEAPRKLVVYYANETTDRAYRSANYRKLLAILKKSENPLAADIVKRLTSDMHLFTAAVERDAEALLEAAAAHGFDLVLFTNALALDAQFRVYSTATQQVETRPFATPAASADPVTKLSPLARPEVFQAALLAAISSLSPERPDLVLITNSHGTTDMALMPRVNIDLSTVSGDDVLRLLDRRDGFERPAWATLKGTDKVAYWQTLAAVSARTGARYPLVLRLACQSGLSSFSEFRAIPASVGLVGHTAEYSITLGAFDASALFGPEASGDWFEALVGNLEWQNVQVDSRTGLSLWLVLVAARAVPVWLYFAPLVLWLAWLALARRRGAANDGRMEHG